jgi:hypothetical protein
MPLMSAAGPSPMQALPKSPKSPSLITLLAVFVGTQQLLSPLLHPRESKIGDLIIRFSYALGSVFSVLLFCLALWLALWRVGSAPRFRAMTRLGLSIVGGVTLLLAALGLAIPLPASLVFHLRTGATFFALLTVIAILGSRARPVFKLGMGLVFLPIVLQFLAAAWVRLTVLGPVDPNALALQSLAEASLIATTLLSPILFRPEGRRPRRALYPTLLTFVGASGIVIGDWNLGNTICHALFGIDLPLRPIFGVLYAFALAVLVYSISVLLLSGGRDRLRGQGLLLLSLCGLRLHLPYQAMVVSLGFLCLLDACLRTHEKALSRTQFDGLIKTTSALLRAPQVTVTGREGFEMARLHSQGADGPPIAIVFERQSHAPKIMEVVVGETPPRDPPFSLASAHMTARARWRGPRIETGDPLFDAHFRLQDRRGLGSTLLDESTRIALRSHVRGWLDVWPQRGLRYRTDEWPGESEMGSLVAILQELARRSG